MIAKDGVRESKTFWKGTNNEKETVMSTLVNKSIRTTLGMLSEDKVDEVIKTRKKIKT